MRMTLEEAVTFAERWTASHPNTPAHAFPNEDGVTYDWDLDTELDTSSSAARQHYIDTGAYLDRGQALTV